MNDILLVRADASPRIGTGHVMRCMALGQAWQDRGGEVVFVMSLVPPGVEARLRAENMRVVLNNHPAGSEGDALFALELAEVLRASWIAVDGYQFDSSYQKTISGSGRKVLWIDDFGCAPPYCADLILNQNIAPDEKLYLDRSPETRILLGTRYAPLRREFGAWHGKKREPGECAEKILVTLGGSDPDNATLKVVEGISRIRSSRIHARVVVGAVNSNVNDLCRACDQSFVRIEPIIHDANMPELMAWADVAVSAGGTTCWEMAFMGLPNLIVVLADNQCALAEHLCSHGASINLGWHESISAQSIAHALNVLLGSRDVRTSMSEAGRMLVDGEGADRVNRAMRDSEPNEGVRQ